VGYWQNDRRNGPGKTVKKVIRKVKKEKIEEEVVEEGIWKNDVLVQKLDEDGNLLDCFA